MPRGTNAPQSQCRLTRSCHSRLVPEPLSAACLLFGYHCLAFVGTLMEAERNCKRSPLAQESPERSNAVVCLAGTPGGITMQNTRGQLFYLPAGRMRHRLPVPIIQLEKQPCQSKQKGKNPDDSYQLREEGESVRATANFNGGSTFLNISDQNINTSNRNGLHLEVRSPFVISHDSFTYTKMF